MTLRIAANLERVRQGIMNGTISAIDLAENGRDAIFAGIGTPAWDTLMLNFVANGTKELERLCGKDQAFRGTEWGELCLVYIAGDSTCTSETSMETGTQRSMRVAPSRRMLELLDAEGTDLKMLNDEALSAKTSNASDSQDLRNPSNTDPSDTDTSNDKD